MFTQISKGWLIAAAIMMASGLASVRAADQPEVIYEASPVKAGTEGMLVAKADAPAPPKAKAEVEAAAPQPDSAPIGEAAPAGEKNEKIEVNFSEPEQDILTREAMSKLDVVIESLEFVNADLHNVIRIIGERLNINFIFDAEDITGKVTLRLHNIRLRDALDSILTTRKLSIVADKSGIFRIVPQERVGKKTVETKTEVIPLNWISAEDVQKTMKSFLTDAVGKLEYNEESNAVIITDVPPQIEVVRGLINQLDMPERQVLIEARLADVNVGALRELGSKVSVTKINDDALNTIESRNRSVGPDVITGRRDENGKLLDTIIETVTKTQYLGGQKIGEAVTTGLPGVKGIDPTPLSNAGGLLPVLLDGLQVDKGKGTFSLGEKIGIFGADYDLNAVFTALEERNVVEILANPRVSTLNNVPAKISIIEKIPYIQASGMTSGGTQVPTIDFADAGVDIQVKPIITPNGFVRLEIDLKQMIFRERVGTGSLDPPAIDERLATTNVIVPDQETVVLGGLRQQRRLENISGVPWMHRIPLIGWLFKDKQHDQSRIELVLMMTPRIIEKHAGLTETERYWYNKIDNNWHLPDYFFDEVGSALDKKGKGLPGEKAPSIKKDKAVKDDKAALKDEKAMKLETSEHKG